MAGTKLKAAKARSAPKAVDKKANGRERHRQALELRRAGFGYQQIADALGYADPSGAAQAVKAELDRIPKMAAEDVLALHTLQYEHFMALLYRRATRTAPVFDHDGNPVLDGNGQPVLMLANDALPFLDRLVAIMGKRESLMGLTGGGGGVTVNVQQNSGSFGNTILAGVETEAEFVAAVQQAIEAAQYPKDSDGNIIDVEPVE